MSTILPVTRRLAARVSTERRDRVGRVLDTATDAQRPRDAAFDDGPACLRGLEDVVGHERPRPARHTERPGVPLGPLAVDGAQGGDVADDVGQDDVVHRQARDVHRDHLHLGERAAHAVGVHERHAKRGGPGDRLDPVGAADLRGHHGSDRAAHEPLDLGADGQHLTLVAEHLVADGGGADAGHGTMSSSSAKLDSGRTRSGPRSRMLAACGQQARPDRPASSGAQHRASARERRQILLAEVERLPTVDLLHCPIPPPCPSSVRRRDEPEVGLDKH